MPATVSYLCPSVNSYRRLREFAAPPVTATWGEENKSTGIRLICDGPKTARIEHRVGAGDLNPYHALAAILAGGLTGLAAKQEPPPEFTDLAWGIPASVERLPSDIMTAAKTLEACDALKQELVAEDVEYWIKSRRHEWMTFHRAGNDPDSPVPGLWEFQRYFVAS
jgi:glutamine synthetase